MSTAELWAAGCNVLDWLSYCYIFPAKNPSLCDAAFRRNSLDHLLVTGVLVTMSLKGAGNTKRIYNVLISPSKKTESELRETK